MGDRRPLAGTAAGVSLWIQGVIAGDVAAAGAQPQRALSQALWRGSLLCQGADRQAWLGESGESDPRCSQDGLFAGACMLCVSKGQSTVIKCAAAV